MTAISQIVSEVQPVGPDVRLPRPYYEDEFCTIYNDDCRNILPLLGPVHTVITDPPYGVGLTAFDDDFSVSPIGIDLCGGQLAAIFMSPRRVIALASQLKTWDFERLLWMHKDADLAMPWRGWCMNSEAILLFSRQGARWPTPSDFRSDLYRVAPWGKVGHPNAKPPTVIYDLVRRLSEPGSTVLDPFVGSGTTAVACRQLGRKCIAVELEEKYCRIAVERLQQAVLPLTPHPAPVAQPKLWED